MLKKQKEIITRHLAILFIGLIIIHFSIISYLINDKINFNKIKRDSHLYQHIINSIIDIGKASTAPNSTIELIGKYGLKSNYFEIVMSIDKKPLYPLIFYHFPKTTDIGEQLQNYMTSGRLLFSYQLAKDRWLNYKETPTYYLYKVSAILIAIEIGIIILIVIYGWAITRYSIPLRHFKYSAEQLGIDVSTYSIVPATGPHLVQETSQAMFKMQQRIRDLIDTRTKMLAAISHDLRTPITRMRLRAELIEPSNDIVKMINDLDEMEHMIKGILNFASNDMVKENKSKFDLCLLIANVYNEYLEMKKDITIHLQVETALFLGRALALKRVLNNIINNAFKFADKVKLNLYISKNTIIITIKDNGPGIQESELTEVFDAYYKSSATAAKNLAGAGLGLSICREIIKDHEGSITLANHKSGGLEVTISLPIIN